MSLLDKIERVLFGASASERVGMMVELASHQAAQRITAALDADDDEPRQCVKCGFWEVYGAGDLCDTCEPED